MKYFLRILVVTILLTTSAFSKWIPGDTLIDNRDGQKYGTVVIGNQVWMSENLNIGNMILSTAPGYQMSNNGIIEKYCWNNDEDYCDGTNSMIKKGGFYEWKEATQIWGGQYTLPVHGICPKEWHIPSMAEWNELLNYLGGNTAYSKMLVDGGSGFDAKLTGYRCTITGSFRSSATASDTRTYYWTSQQTDANNAPMIELGANSLTSFSFTKSLGLCIRCMWDGETSAVQNQSENINILELKLSPNPVIESNILSYSLNGKSNQTVNIYVIDNLGNKVVELVNTETVPGNYTIHINTNHLSSGIYYVIGQANKSIITLPMILIK